MPDIEALVAAFVRAGEMLKRLILSVLSDKPTPINEASRGVGQVIDSLKNLSVRWVVENAPKVYISGHRKAGGDASTPDDLDARLRASLDVQIVSLTSRLLSASEAMREDSLGKLRHAAHLRLQAVMLGEQGIGKAGSEFRDEIQEEGITLKDRLGRKIQPESYARGTLRSASGTLLNNGTLETAVSLGSPAVRVHDNEGPNSCEPCKIADGEHWSLEYAMANVLEHVNCVRAFSVKPSSWSGELDRE